MKKIIFVFLILLANPVYAETEEYTVEKGDTLLSILKSKDYGDTYQQLQPFVQQIVDLNPDIFTNSSVDKIFPGITIILPANPNRVIVQPEPEPVPEPEPLPEPEPEPLPEPEPVIGVVKVLKGNSLIRRKSDAIEVPGQTELIESDIVITGPDSVAEVRMADETVFKLGPDSTLNVSNFSISSSQAEQPEGSLIASIIAGAIKVTTGLLAKHKANQYQISSLFTATIGIRGTDFTVRACSEKPACGDLFGVSVAVEEGGISFSNSVATLDLNKDEFTQIKSSEETPVAAPIPEGFFDLELGVDELQVEKSILQRIVDWIESF